MSVWRSYCTECTSSKLYKDLIFCVTHVLMAVPLLFIEPGKYLYFAFLLAWYFFIMFYIRRWALIMMLFVSLIMVSIGKLIFIAIFILILMVTTNYVMGAKDRKQIYARMPVFFPVIAFNGLAAITYNHIDSVWAVVMTLLDVFVLLISAQFTRSKASIKLNAWFKRIMNLQSIVTGKQIGRAHV